MLTGQYGCGPGTRLRQQIEANRLVCGDSRRPRMTASRKSCVTNASPLNSYSRSLHRAALVLSSFAGRRGQSVKRVPVNDAQTGPVFHVNRDRCFVDIEDRAGTRHGESIAPALRGRVALFAAPRSRCQSCTANSGPVRPIDVWSVWILSRRAYLYAPEVPLRQPAWTP